MIITMAERAIIKILEPGNGYKKPKEDFQPSGLYFGQAHHPYDQRRLENVHLSTQDRLRHIYIIGSTGTGKTKLIESFVRQDILNGRGFALIDPHGDLIQAILSFLARNFHDHDGYELGRQLILIEPFNREFAVGFNPLHAIGGHFPAMLELTEIFKRFWGNGYWGPRMDELLRNTIMSLAENNLTFLEARPLLTNSGFRQRLIENVSFTEIRDYWQYRYNPLSEKMQAIYREPVLNKISRFVTDPSIYRILCQSQSRINFREAMDQGKWVLLNLSKGQLKENISLLGTLFLAKIKHAALSRVGIPERNRRPFFVFVDEFQNFVGNDFEEILSEARKYRLGLTLAHQNLDQVPRELRAAILGNVGTEIFFRLSHHDASQVSSEMDQKERHLIERRLIDLKVGEAYLKNKSQSPRLLKTPYVPSVRVSEEAIERIKRASFQNWARPVRDVEAEIEERRRLWMSVESGPRFKESRARPLREYITFPPEGQFEEGQSEW
jgi:hypothetical protein